MMIREWACRGWKPRRNWSNVLGQRETWGCLVTPLDRWVMVRYVPFAGYVLVVVRLGGPAGTVLAEFRHWEIAEMKKRSADQVAATPLGAALVSSNTKLLDKCPHIVKQCSVVKYDDGDARQPGSLFISTQGSMWRVTVTEPDACLKLSMLALELDDAVAAVELALGSESIPWEVDTYAMSRKPKNRK